MIRLAALLCFGLGLCLAIAAVVAAGNRQKSPGFASPAGTCPPPLKLAAGACVRACPGGYEDRGRECVFRNQAR